MSVSELRRKVHERNRRFPHDKTIIYCSRSTVGAVQAELQGVSWFLFLATLDGTRPKSWDGKPTIAVQYWGGGNAPYDLSWWWDRRDLHVGPALP